MEDLKHQELGTASYEGLITCLNNVNEERFCHSNTLLT